MLLYTALERRERGGDACNLLEIHRGAGEGTSSVASVLDQPLRELARLEPRMLAEVIQKS